MKKIKKWLAHILRHQLKDYIPYTQIIETRSDVIEIFIKKEIAQDFVDRLNQPDREAYIIKPILIEMVEKMKPYLEIEMIEDQMERTWHVRAKARVLQPKK